MPVSVGSVVWKEMLIEKEMFIDLLSSSRSRRRHQFLWRGGVNFWFVLVGFLFRSST